MTHMVAPYLIVVGLIVLVLSSVINTNTQMLATNSTVARCNQGLYSIAIMFLSVGLTVLASGDRFPVSEHLALGFTVVLGVVLTVLAAIIVNKSGAGPAKNAAVATLVLGVLFMAGSVGLVVHSRSSLFGERMRFQCY